MMTTMSKIPATWPNFSLKVLDMISEGNKVFARVHATADNMDTMFGHYFEVTDEGKTKVMMTFDDTLSMFNAMKK
jgi:predicted ester cyclase